MTIKKSAGKNKLPSKKTIIGEISPLIADAVATLKEKLGKKKFEKRVRKAAKLFSDKGKQVAVKKSSVKKAAKKVGKKTIGKTASKK